MASLIPDAATYGAEQSAATEAYQKAKNNVQLGQLGLMNRYGLTADYNPETNGYANYRTDPYSQYGLIQQNRTSEAMDLNAAQDNSIQRGLGSSGLGNQQASAARYQHGVQDIQLGQDFMSGMGQYDQQLADAGSNYKQSLFGAENDAITRALQKGQFDSYNSPDNPGDNSDSLNIYDPKNTNSQSDPFANLNNLTEADWTKLKNLPVNKTKTVLAKALAKKARPQ